MMQDQDLMVQDEVSAVSCAPSRKAIILQVCVFLFLLVLHFVQNFTAIILVPYLK